MIAPTRGDCDNCGQWQPLYFRFADRDGKPVMTCRSCGCPPDPQTIDARRDRISAGWNEEIENSRRTVPRWRITFDTVYSFGLDDA